jgi:hypothetical protein
VLTIDGAASGIMQATTTESATMTLHPSNITATMVFNKDTIGGTLTLGNQTITLGAGVDKLPE